MAEETNSFSNEQEPEQQEEQEHAPSTELVSADVSSGAEDDAGDDLYIVGIGASAGGLEALEEFFTNMPNENNMAFVVIQHLSPDYKSLMVEILSKHTPMKVYQAEDGAQVEANCVYLIPRKKNMTIFHGKIFLTEQEHGHGGLNLPIDIFFRSLAEDQGEKAIAVVLSGTGSDGTRGIRAVKEAGGMIMVQSEESAKFDGMPRSAIATRLVDYILPPNKMANELLKYIKHPYVANKKSNDAIILDDQDNLTKVFAIIRNHTGVDFTYYKPSTVIRRIERRMSINQIEDINDYLKYLYQSPVEVTTLFKELLIGVTKFFRDQETFEVLKQRVIPDIFENKNYNESIRVWVAGCSTGEEAYSLAILFREYMDLNNTHVDVKVFATDIDKDAIEFAGAGIYPESIAADVSINRLRRFFMKKAESYQISREVREMVVFAPHSLTKDPPFSKIDLISCRNLLIYLQPVLQKKVLSIFNFALNENGFLFLGSSETVGDMISYFYPYDNKNKIFKYKGGFQPSISETFTVPQVQERQQSSPPLNFPTPQHTMPPMTSGRNIESIYEILLEAYVPACVFINDQYEVLHVIGDVNEFLRIPVGKMNINILKMVHKDLSIALSTAVHKAMKDNKEVVYKDIVIHEKDVVKRIHLVVKPVKDRQSKESLFLVLFEDVEENRHVEGNVEEFNMENQANQRIKDLEQELQYTKENLQATIEELETSNEELQATNEELLAANEELQSTNEELQSVNEELITVNSEHQIKIQELTVLNNDMNNLLSTTEIGVIFLDKDLRVRKFTPAITKVINLINLDIGRPLTHIAHTLQYDGMTNDAKEVLRTLVPREHEVQNEEGSWFLLKVIPYKTLDNIVKGVVITLLNIDNIKKADEGLRMRIDVDEQSPSLITTFDTEGKVIYVNTRFCDDLGYEPSEVIGKRFEEFFATASANPTPTDMWKTLEEGTVWEGEIVSLNKDGTHFTEHARIIPIRNDEGEITSYYKISKDITHEKETEETLAIERDRLAHIVEASPIAITIVSIDGKIVFANKRAEELFSLTHDKMKERYYNAREWKSTDYEGHPIPEEKLPFNRIRRDGKPLYNVKEAIEDANGKKVYLRINGSPIFNKETGELAEVVFAIHAIPESEAISKSANDESDS